MQGIGHKCFHFKQHCNNHSIQWQTGSDDIGNIFHQFKISRHLHATATIGECNKP